MFESMGSLKGPNAAKRLLALLISIMLHALAVLLLVVLPLVFFRLMPDVNLLTLLIAAPGPPIPPPPPPPLERRAPAAEAKPPVRFASYGWIPEKVPIGIPVPENEPEALIGPLSIASGLGLLGAGGPAALVGIDSIFHSVPPTAAPPPPPPVRTLLKVGGKVQEARLIRKVPPVYPDLARRVRVSGEVVLEVTIDEEGNVMTCVVRQGHPLLVEAAVQAVRQWKYSPTLLNDEPVQVASTVTVRFILN